MTIPTRIRSLHPLRRLLAPWAAVALALLAGACATGKTTAPEPPAAPAAATSAEADGAAATTQAEAPAASAPADTADTADTAAAAPATATAEAEPVELETADATSPVAALLDDPAAITAGRRMFRAVCTGYCHSTTPGVTKDAPNLFDCSTDHGDTDADLYRVINQGVPNTEMLPFEGKIPDETLWQVIAYIRSNSMECSSDA